MDDGRLTDEVSEIAERLTVAARSWTRPDAMEHRDPATEVELLLETMNELNARRLRIAELEARIEKAKRQISVADRYAREAKPAADKVASTWEIQNGLIHDALSGV